jgi:peptidoglycan hydrolase-like protein with peptidoglycan-binding domain
MKHQLAAASVAAAVIAASALAAANAATASTRTQALLTVNMEKVLLAAQWDPRKPDAAVTPGAGASVTTVERALQAEGLLAKRYVDGHFGTVTVKAYAAWQRSLGYSDNDASGLPGATSLRALGEQRFVVTHVVKAGPRTTYNGVTVNARTKAMLQAADDRIGPRLRMEQGSYSTSDPTSAGTHAGGGAVDIHVDNMTRAQRVNAVKQLRRVGFAAWLRSPSQGEWGWHIHGVAVSDPDLSPPAQHQVGDYYRGLNGLANRRPDDGPTVARTTWEDYLRSR